ncbi:MFS transporter [Streptomyces sp. NPDC055897]
MAAAILVNGLGSGLFMPLSALYFTTVVRLSPGDVAAGLGVAAVAGTLAGVPFGMLADHLGAKKVLIALLLATAVMIPLYLFIADRWQFMAVASAISALDRGIAGIAGALVANVIPGAAERTRVRAMLRAVLAMGLTIGASLSAVVLSVRSPAAYTVAVLADALTFALAGLIYLRLPAGDNAPRTPQASRMGVLKDTPFLGITAMFSVLSASNWAVAFALPLWAVRHTQLPAAVIAAAAAVNTAGHLLLQVPVAHQITTLRRAVRATVAGGVLLALACVLFSVTSIEVTALAAGLLLTGVVVNLTGGLCIASAQFFITSEVAPESAQGQYQGFVSTGAALSSIFSPSLFVALPLAHATPGWIAVAVLFAGSGALAPQLVRLARRSSVPHCPSARQHEEGTNHAA